MTDEQIMTLAKSYAAHTGLKLSTIGAYAARDGRFFLTLSEGRECRRRTRKKVAGWFSEHWPSDLEWPAEIERPAAKTASKGAA